MPVIPCSSVFAVMPYWTIETAALTLTHGMLSPTSLQLVRGNYSDEMNKFVTCYLPHLPC
jgi:hypothetical protein